MTNRAHVIIGDGAAGIAAARRIRSARPNDRIVVLSEDPQPAYFRAALTNYLSGELSDSELWAMPPDAWSRQKFERRVGSVINLNVSARMLTLSDGSELPFDRLLIGSGARASALPTDTVGAMNSTRQVYSLRTLADVRAIIERASRVRSVAILGGGILGIEAAHGLRKRNLNVTLIHRGPAILERVVDLRASALIQNQMAADGIDVRTSCTTLLVQSNGDGERLTLEDRATKQKQNVDVDLVIASIGISPNTEWLAGSGLTLDRGYVVVDGCMRALGQEFIWAAGDVATIRDPVVPSENPGGLWQPAQRQGQIAGFNMGSESGAERAYRPGFILNSTKAWHYDLLTAGAHVDADGDKPEAVETQGQHGLVRKRVLLRDGRIAGFMMLGDRREGSALCRLMNLQGQAGNVEAIVSRLFDPKFDLFGWVAAQEQQPGVSRIKETFYIPRGALPPSDAARKVPVRPRSLVGASGLDKAAMASSVASTTLRVSHSGGSREVDDKGVRIGALVSSNDDIVVTTLAATDGFIEVTRAGAGWMVTPIGERVPATRNGLPLRRPEFLKDSDVIQIGEWKGVISFSAQSNPQAKGMAKPAAGTPSLVLLGQRRHALRSPVTAIGRSSDNHIVLDDETVSDSHAQVLEAPDGWYLVDFGSRAGTTVNNERLAGPRKLAAGDTISLGNIILTCRATQAHEELRNQAVSQREATSHCHLVCVEGPMAPRALRVGLPGTIGRDDMASHVIDDPLLSRIHARVEFDTGRHFLTDLGSANGTSVDGLKVRGGQRVLLNPRARVALGSHVFRFEVDEPAAFAVRGWMPQGASKRYTGGTRHFKIGDTPAVPLREFTLEPVDLVIKDTVAAITLKGAGPHILSSSPDLSAVVFPVNGVSRKHAEIVFDTDRYLLRDLGSRNGTFLNEERLAETARPLADGDVIRLHLLRLAFRQGHRIKEAEDIQVPHEPASLSPLRFDNWDSQDNPLETDFEKIVAEELDACIGCHVCLRACPLPEAKDVTIAALNNFMTGAVDPTDVARKFVSDCTQCHACVPVCPANIRRSRIVLWNKLKVVPDRNRPLVAQASVGTVGLQLTGEELDRDLASHELFAELTADERQRTYASARIRQLVDGETLLAEGQFVDALWILLSGKLTVGASMAGVQFQPMVILEPGKFVGERAVLSDSTSDTTVVSSGKSLAIGLPKYVLRSLGARNPRYRDTLDRLYLSRTVEAVLRKSSVLSGATDLVIRRIANESRAERFSPGETVLRSVDAGVLTCIVIRGFIKQVSERGGKSIVSDYLKAGDAFGAAGRQVRERTLQWDAATLAEVLVIKAETIRVHLRGITATGAIGDKAVVSDVSCVHADVAVDSIMQAHRPLVIDTQRCVDCDNCVDACERRHGHSRIDRVGSGKQIGQYHVPGSCYHCEDPVCLLCAVDGIVREPTGEIRIVDDSCIGCGACAERCPYDNIQMVSRESKPIPGIVGLLPRSWQQLLGEAQKESVPSQYQRVAVKCDLCAGHEDGPACVRSCPTGAAQRGNSAELLALVPKP